MKLWALGWALCAVLGPVQERDWQRAFDGTSLSGWVTKGGRYDGNADWSVAEGAIIGREGENHAGGLIYTDARYRNCEIELETWITDPFDSGIFFRMQPEQKGVQITLDYRPDGEVGGIYSEGWLFHNTRGKDKFRAGQWNRVRARCVGQPMHLMVWLNGELLTDFRIPENHGDFAERGRLGLQVHGNRDDPPGSHVKFRNIRIRSLPNNAGNYFEGDDTELLRLTEQGRRAGWQSLLATNGLAGWTAAGDGTGFRNDNGVLALLVDGNSPCLMSEQDYRNFHVRLDFRLARMANSGVFLRAARDGSNPAYSGCEVQILDDHHWQEVTRTTLQPSQFCGSLYGAVAPPVQALKPVGEWNTYEITCVDSRILTVLNGKILYDVDTDELSAEPPFQQRADTGFLGLQRHAEKHHVRGDAYAWFRNIFIRPLPGS